ncbi:MAG TPA: glycosyl hydrolase [Solirubrobacterales bacterium]|nr:glycosyl hydrolase [Solirubrobacterales bacterium]
MVDLPKTRAVVALACAAALLLALTAAPAGAFSLLKPPGKKVYFGISDTGDMADFGHFSDAVHKHPAVIESFRTWGSDFPDSIQRWQTARARPMIHISTADNNDGHELITPAQIAAGQGDRYLVRLNKLFFEKEMRAYVRPLGEPNRCLNVWAAYDCAGASRGPDHSTRAYKLAFRRIYVIVHGGGKRRVINRRLAQAGLPPLTVNVGALPVAPVAIVWSPLPSGSPTVAQNRPRHFYPGSRWVDWVGTDFYAGYPEWKSLTGLYRRYSNKPFAIAEWAVEGADDPSFVNKLFAWVRSHHRCKMLVYYQDFGDNATYRIQNYSSSLSVLRARLHSGLFPAYAPGAPHLPPPPPGGVAAP